jgi:hypothetical protein
MFPPEISVVERSVSERDWVAKIDLVVVVEIKLQAESPFVPPPKRLKSTGRYGVVIFIS